jgi:hypothetical protein
MALLLVEELGMCSELEPSPIASKEKTQPQEEAWEWERVLFESELCDVPKVSKKHPAVGRSEHTNAPQSGQLGRKIVGRLIVSRSACQSTNRGRLFSETEP